MKPQELNSTKSFAEEVHLNGNIIAFPPRI